MKKSIGAREKKAELKVFYVDPMSYSNLALYDYSLLSNIQDIDLYYFCNIKYDSGPLNARCRKIYRYSDKGKALKIGSYLRSQLSLLRLIFQNRPAIVHFQWLKAPKIDYLLIKVIRKLGVKIVLTVHNVLPHNTGGRYAKIYNKIYTLVDAVIVHSHNTKTELVERFNVSTKKIFVIPHGILNIRQNIDLEKVDFYIKKFSEDFELDNKLVFSALGTINDYKGIDLIVEAWKLDNITKNDDLKLIIAGKGGHRKMEEIKGKTNVIIESRFLLVEEFLALLKLTDFVLLPYRQISQSGVLLTAINEKKRVIVSNVGGLTDPFEFGEIGYILPELNSEELNRAIIKASQNANCYPTAETWNGIYEYFDWKNIGLKTKSLYHSITSQGF